MAFNKLYLSNTAAGYTPATLRGAWDDTVNAVTKALVVYRRDTSTRASVSRNETSTSNTFDVLLYRGVSHPLSAQTINCNLDVVIGVSENNIAADFYWHLYVYVTQGDSDTPRGVLINDYVENTSNEWTTTLGGLALASAQAINLAISAGDRIVAEIGFISRNTSGLIRTGTLSYGGSDVIPDVDLVVGNGYLTGIPFISFSANIDDPALTTDITHVGVRTLSIGTSSARISQLVVRTLSPKAAAPTALPRTYIWID